jgi:hypothetical protein
MQKLALTISEQTHKIKEEFERIFSMDNKKKVYCSNCKFSNKQLDTAKGFIYSEHLCCYEQKAIKDNFYHKKCRCIETHQTKMSIINQNNNCVFYKPKWYRIFS